MYNILLLEDDKFQRNSLAKMVKEMGETVNVLESSSAEEALAICKYNNIDLFYIDIDLGASSKSGFEFAVEIRKFSKYKFTWIVFITASMSYVLPAFKDTHCYDYISKPYSKAKIKSLTLSLLQNKVCSNDLLNSFEPEKNQRNDFIIFNINNINIKLFFHEIIFIEVNLRTSYIHTINGMYEGKNLSLKKLIEMLPSECFLQSHRSFVINKNFIKKIDKNSSYWQIYFDMCEETVPLGDKFKDKVISAFDNTII